MDAETNEMHEPTIPHHLVEANARITADTPSPRMSEIERLVMEFRDACMWLADWKRSPCSSLDEATRAYQSARTALLTAIRALTEVADVAEKAHPYLLPFEIGRHLRHALDRARSTEPVNTETR
jgi:hypothetical protein